MTNEVIQTSMAASVISCSDDLLSEILSHLLAKTLLRFKSVSKQWKFLISDRKLTVNHSQNTYITSPPSVFLKWHYRFQSITVELQTLTLRGIFSPIYDQFIFELNIKYDGAQKGVWCYKLLINGQNSFGIWNIPIKCIEIWDNAYVISIVWYLSINMWPLGLIVVVLVVWKLLSTGNGFMAWISIQLVYTQAQISTRS